MKAGADTESNSFYFHITYPVNQIIAFSKKETQIYYPDEKKAIIMENKDSVSNGNFMELATKKMDLKAMGFKLVESKKSKSSNTETWAPQNITGVPIKSITIQRDQDGRLLLMEMRAKDGSVMTRTEYSGYTEILGKKIPLYIKTYAGNEKGSYQEMIKLSNTVENAKLPDMIQNFSIPKDAEVKRIKF